MIGCSIFFRARSYRLSNLREAWHRFVLSKAIGVEVDGRLVLLGDHTHVVKDGGRIPGVVSLRETSDTQSKPAYFRGQCWGAVGLLVGTLSQSFCLPLSLQLHLGFQHLALSAQDADGLSMGERVVQMALDFAFRRNRRVWLVLDAFFGTGPVFRRAASLYSVKTRQPWVTIVTRAKKSYVAYFPASPPPKGKRGARKRYGGKLRLQDAFRYPPLFRACELEIYGKTETVLLMSRCLLWKPLGWRQPLQFIWATTSQGSVILMCSDVEANPETVVQLYCARTRIETLFATLKQVMGVFRFHFWSQSLPKHSRTPVTNKQLKTPLPEHAEKVRDCWRAMECFVLCGTIATGLLQWFALKYHNTLWQQQRLYLRTRSRQLPSENTVRQIVAPLLARQFTPSPPNSHWWLIHQAVNGEYEEPDEHKRMTS